MGWLFVKWLGRRINAVAAFALGFFVAFVVFFGDYVAGYTYVTYLCASKAKYEIKDKLLHEKCGKNMYNNKSLAKEDYAQFENIVSNINQYSTVFADKDNDCLYLQTRWNIEYFTMFADNRAGVSINNLVKISNGSIFYESRNFFVPCGWFARLISGRCVLTCRDGDGRGVFKNRNNKN